MGSVRPRKLTSIPIAEEGRVFYDPTVPSFLAKGSVAPGSKALTVTGVAALNAVKGGESTASEACRPSSHLLIDGVGH